MPLSKSLRFEIFARDGFTCQYCGMRPPDVVLEVDHIHPSSKGGSDEKINLITSCYACNRGKRAKVISAVAPRPDADIEFLRVEQESAEVVRFLKSKKKRDKEIQQACEVLREAWATFLTEMVPSDRVLVPWIDRYGVDEVYRCILLAVPSYNKNRFGHDQERAFNKLLPYVGAILRNRIEDRDSGAVQ